ncbi:response regulator [Dyella acidiphila]|uniref:Response regulator n=1 Tax=Dyella acidiphila TaxID=2775866 RepID=A0ABR9GCS7_9GAMM|nr:response regulator [Dyella acidiphila]MBE1161839.1 response regulator [Dyella acidiphila]
MATTVLLVDDQPEVLEVTAYMLEDAGYNVLCANDSEQAREMVAGRRDIGVIITDLHLPHGTSGIDMGLALRREGLVCPLLVVSGALAPEQIDQHAWVSYLSKPFGREALLQKITALACGP